MVSVSELALIESDPPERTASVPWAQLFPLRETWAFAVAKFFTDPQLPERSVILADESGQIGIT